MIVLLLMVFIYLNLKLNVKFLQMNLNIGLYFLSIMFESESWTTFSICVMSMAKSLKISDASNEAKDMFDVDFAQFRPFKLLRLALNESDGINALYGDFPSKLNVSSSGVINNFALMC